MILSSSTEWLRAFQPAIIPRGSSFYMLDLCKKLRGETMQNTDPKDHFCQEDGNTGRCIVCGDKMPTQPKDHFCQEDGNTGRCIVCGDPMPS